MKNHFILDFETMGQDSLTVAAVECSYVMFDWDRFIDNPYKYDELLSLVKKDKLDVKEQVQKYGFKVEKSSLEWWSKLPKEVSININPSDRDISIDKFVRHIISYIGKTNIKFWWSRSNTFDPIILDRMSKLLNLKHQIDTVLPFWRIRDTRTFIDAKFSFNNKSNSFIPFENEQLWNSKFKQHDSSHDIVADILRLQTITRFENELQPIE